MAKVKRGQGIMTDDWRNIDGLVDLVLTRALAMSKRQSLTSSLIPYCVTCDDGTCQFRTPFLLHSSSRADTWLQTFILGLEVQAGRQLPVNLVLKSTGWDWEVVQISTTSLDNGTYYLCMSCWWKFEFGCSLFRHCKIFLVSFFNMLHCMIFFFNIISSRTGKLFLAGTRSGAGKVFMFMKNSK